MRLIFLVALLMNICLSAAQAEERIALVVGNTVFARAPRITNAAVNADNMTSALRGLGFDVTEMIDAGDTDLRAAMENFRARLSAGDAVGLFYYSGYAAQFEGANFLLPSDFELGNRTHRGSRCGCRRHPARRHARRPPRRWTADRPARSRGAAVRLDQRHRARPGNAGARPKYDRHDFGRADRRSGSPA